MLLFILIQFISCWIFICSHSPPIAQTTERYSLGVELIGNVKMSSRLFLTPVAIPSQMRLLLALLIILLDTTNVHGIFHFSSILSDILRW